MFLLIFEIYSECVLYNQSENQLNDIKDQSNEDSQKKEIQKERNFFQFNFDRFITQKTTIQCDSQHSFQITFFK